MIKLPNMATSKLSRETILNSRKETRCNLTGYYSQVKGEHLFLNPINNTSFPCHKTEIFKHVGKL